MIMVSSVEVTSPPMTTVARGRCTSAPAEVEMAMGRKPRAAADAVITTGRSLSRVPLKIRSLMSVMPFLFSSLRCSIKTIPLRTAMPKRAMNPTPAEILKGIPRIQRRRILPTAERGMALKIIRASRKEWKAKWRRMKIRSRATGTAMRRRWRAERRF